MIPAAGEKGSELKDIPERLSLFHIMADKFKKAVYIGTAQQMYQLRSRSARADDLIACALNIHQRMVFVNGNYLIHEICKTSTLAAAYQKLENVEIFVDKVDDRVYVVLVFCIEFIIVKEVFLLVNRTGVIAVHVGGEHTFQLIGTLRDKSSKQPFLVAVSCVYGTRSSACIFGDSSQ